MMKVKAVKELEGTWVDFDSGTGHESPIEPPCPGLYLWLPVTFEFKLGPMKGRVRVATGN
jgi:hypothetical protein